MPRTVHTPYDGSSRPFTIALTPLDPDQWIEVDDQLDAYLREKDQHFADQHEVVFRAHGDTVDAQDEVLELLWAYLPNRYPEQYTVSGSTITVTATGTAYGRDDFADRPLELAARLVQEDLIIMRASPEGHRLVAAALCFPSSWSLAEKFGHPLADIHAPVPGFSRGTRIAGMIERIFQNLKTDQPIQRYNWSLYDSPRLHYIERHHAGDGQLWRSEAPNAWLRVERQTLRRLPVSSDILFTIKICVDPFTVLAQLPNASEVAKAFAAQLRALDDAQLAYKGLVSERDAIAALLDKIGN